MKEVFVILMSFATVEDCWTAMDELGWANDVIAARCHPVPIDTNTAPLSSLRPKSRDD